MIGVEEKDGRPVHPLKGVPADKVDGYLKDMLNKCKRIQPEYLPIVEVVDYQDKKFIVVWAPGRYLRPYSSPKSMAKEEKERVCYIRKMSSTIMPSEEEKRDLYNLANNVPFDDRVNHEADIVDLNLTLIQAYLKEVESSLYEESKRMDFLDLCRSINIVNTLPEYTKPKNMGLMFFSLEPDRFFPYAQIDVVQFPEDLVGDQIIEKTFKGPLHRRLREALQYIRNSVIQEQVIKLLDRAETEHFFNTPTLPSKRVSAMRCITRDTIRGNLSRSVSSPTALRSSAIRGRTGPSQRRVCGPIGYSIGDTATAVLGIS